MKHSSIEEIDMKKTFLFLACMLSFCLALGSVHAQDIEENVSEYDTKNGRLYLQPLADTFGANLNSGFFRSAKIEKLGFHIQLGIVAMGAFVTDDQKTFIAVPEDDFNPPPNTELPTVFGSEEGVYVEELGESVPGAWDTKIFPLAVPQLTVGSLLGTEVVLRWIDFKIDDSIGNIKLSGFGVRHSVSQYIPLCPVDLAVGYFRQSFEVGDIVEAHATYMGLQCSHSFSILCLYGGIGYESAKLDISYTHEQEGESYDVNFELDAKNSTRFTVGLAFDLPILKIHADYSIASQKVFALGIGLGI